MPPETLDKAALKESFTHNDIYTSFQYYGFPLFSHLSGKQGRVLPVDKLVLETLDQGVTIREFEILPAILTYNDFNPYELSKEAKINRIEQKTGYMCELTSTLQDVLNIDQNRHLLDISLNELRPGGYDGTKVPLINGLGGTLSDYLQVDDVLENRWGIIGCLDITEVIEIIQKGKIYIT